MTAIVTRHYTQAMSEQQTPDQQFRAFLTDLFDNPKLKRAERIEAIAAEFGEWIEAYTRGPKVEIEGSRVVVEHVELFGLRIGLDATGRAVSVEHERNGMTEAPQWVWA